MRTKMVTALLLMCVACSADGGDNAEDRLTAEPTQAASSPADEQETAADMAEPAPAAPAAEAPAADAGVDDFDPGAPARGTTTSFLGDFCGAHAEWAFQWQGQVTTWSCGVRREGWVREQAGSSVTVQWASSCTDPQHCTALSNTETLSLAITSSNGGVTALDVGGVHLDRLGSGQCPVTHTTDPGCP